MENNTADHAKLDAYVEDRLTAEQKELLRDENLLGFVHTERAQILELMMDSNYVIDRSGACHRTQTMLRLLLLPLRRWERFVKGIDDGAKEQSQVNKLCATIIKEYLADITDTLATVASLEGMSVKDTLTRRYIQIQGILRAVLTKMKTDN